MTARQEFSFIRVGLALALLALLVAACVVPWVVHNRELVALTEWH